MKFRVEIYEGGILPGWYYGKSYYYVKQEEGELYIKGVFHIYPLHYIVRLINKVINMWWEHITFNHARVICPTCKRVYSGGSLHRIREDA